MTVRNYKKLIMEGIDDLPSDILAEIASFVYFVRRRAVQPDLFEQELENALMYVDLKQLDQAELSHLEEEFKDYDRRYPHG